MRLGWRSFGRGLLAVGFVGLAGLGIIAWTAPAGLIAATDASVRALRDLGFGGAVVFGILQVLVSVSGFYRLRYSGLQSAGFTVLCQASSWQPSAPWRVPWLPSFSADRSSDQLSSD